jgi:hypothetical protein
MNDSNSKQVGKKIVKEILEGKNDDGFIPYMLLY